MIRILHCSDFHFDTANWADQSIVFSAFLEDVKAHRPFDIIIFSGDLVRRGDDASAFEHARDTLIMPLLSAAGTDVNSLILVPGNHEVQLSRVDPIIEKGLVEHLSDRDSVNQFVDDYSIKQYEKIRPRFENFITFAKTCGIDFGTSLSATKLLTRGGLTLGIAMLNSAWRATGKGNEFDYGKLLVGERQVDMAAEQLAKCQIKIAVMHHPLSWLKGFDRSDVARTLYSNYDYIFCGHGHVQDPTTITTASSKAHVLETGCLYHNRKYINSYSILELVDSETASLSMREYTDQRREFVLCNRFARNGIMTLQGEDKNQLSLLLSREAEELITSLVNKQLISSVASTVAPKELRDVFVCPELESDSASSVPASEIAKPAKPVSVGLPGLINESDNDLVFLGRKESGKTTLLNYIALESLPGGKFSSEKSPLIMSFNDIGKKPNSIFEALRKGVDGAVEVAYIRKLVKAKRALILVDDVDFAATEKLGVLKEFLAENPGNRFVFSSLYDPVKASSINIVRFGKDTRAIKIGNLTRANIREFASRWMRRPPGEVADEIDEIIVTAKRMNLPLSPFLVSVLLWLRESEIAFEPINHAVLIETFINGLLSKLTSFIGGRNELDQRNMEHLLGHVAEEMVRRHEHEFSVMELEQVVLDYFKEKFELADVRTSVGDIVGELIARGILFEQSGLVGFKYRCFFEYYVAKRMCDDPEFYAAITDPVSMWKFSSELDVYSGLYRGDKKLLESVYKQAKALFQGASLDYDLSTFEGLPSFFSIRNKVSSEDVRRSLEESKISEHEKDDAFDKQLSPRYADVDQTPKSLQMQLDEMYFAGEATELLSKLFRNSELVSSMALKKEIGREVFVYWAKLILDVMISIEKLIEEDEDVPTEMKEAAPALVLVVFPLAITALMTESLKTSKISSVVKSVMESDDENIIVRMLAGLVYLESIKANRLKVLSSLAEMVSNAPFLAGIVFLKVSIDYTNGVSGWDDKVLDVLVELHQKASASKGNKRQLHIQRQLLIEKLKASKVDEE